MFRTRQRKRLASLAIAALAAASWGAAGCSTLIKPPAPSSGGAASRRASRTPAAPKRSSRKPDERAACPDLADRDALAKVDWSGDFALSSDETKTLTSALIAAAGMEALSAKLDGEVKTACAGITRELGGRADGGTAEAVCAAAVKSINDARARLGAKSRFSIAYISPRCGLPAQAMAACLGRCTSADTEGDAGNGAVSTRLDCPGQSSAGTCEGQCDGSCDATEGMVCDGKCQGGCDWGFRGTCDGTCVGSCNGHASRGICAGRCVGQCFGLARHGTCSGRCLGACQLRHPAPCPGLCAGRCSAPFKSLQCDSVPKSAPGAAACGGSCEIEAAAGAQCSGARLTVTIDKVHGHNHARARQLAGVLERFLPAIIRVSVGMKARATEATRTAESAFRASEQLISSAASRGGPGAGLPACTGGPLRNGLAAMANVNVSVRIALEVKEAADANNAGGRRRG